MIPVIVYNIVSRKYLAIVGFLWTSMQSQEIHICIIRHEDEIDLPICMRNMWYMSSISVLHNFTFPFHSDMVFICMMWDILCPKSVLQDNIQTRSWGSRCQGFCSLLIFIIGFFCCASELYH